MFTKWKSIAAGGKGRLADVCHGRITFHRAALIVKMDELSRQNIFSADKCSH